jgi:hypothetical protein
VGYEEIILTVDLFQTRLASGEAQYKREDLVLSEEFPHYCSFPNSRGSDYYQTRHSILSLNDSAPIIFIFNLVMPERLFHQSAEQQEKNTTEAEGDIEMLREMICLLQSYESSCVAKLDLTGAKQTRERISRLNAKEEELRSKVAKAKQEQQVTNNQYRYWK